MLQLRFLHFCTNDAKGLEGFLPICLHRLNEERYYADYHYGMRLSDLPEAERRKVAPQADDQADMRRSQWEGVRAAEEGAGFSAEGSRSGSSSSASPGLGQWEDRDRRLSRLMKASGSLPLEVG